MFVHIYLYTHGVSGADKPYVCIVYIWVQDVCVGTRNASGGNRGREQDDRSII